MSCGAGQAPPSSGHLQALLVRGGGGASLYEPGSKEALVFTSEQPVDPSITKAFLKSGVQAADWVSSDQLSLDAMVSLVKQWKALGAPIPPGDAGPWSISAIELFLQLERPSGPIFRQMHRDGTVDTKAHRTTLPSGAQSIRPGWTEEYFEDLKLDGPGLLKLLDAQKLGDTPFAPISRSDLATDCKVLVFDPPTDASSEQIEYVEFFPGDTLLAWVTEPTPPPEVMKVPVHMTYDEFKARLPKDPEDAKAFVRGLVG